ncbi:hypothetical protein TeGR_g10011 [Tetraparma gracilis]|jgi:hypothetical protein|uniref:Uncharacterized protein n=1 Tax=Tetraparma gracilis TaxID=2962635 RepID=A0ABQ6N4J4_9STRA|nr:hypothetical protein TeGR_g10011 [Tetraparma gracilis]
MNNRFTIAVVCLALFRYFYALGGAPITQDEFASKLSSSGWSAKEVKEMSAAMFVSEDTGASFLMLNFVKLKPAPDYGERQDLRPSYVETAKQADQYYGFQFLSRLLPKAGHLVFYSESVLPAVLSPYTPSSISFDYFAVVRYRCLRDFAENMEQMSNAFGDSGMKALKMSGVEYTHLVPVSSPGFTHAVTAIFSLLLLLIAR